MSNEVFDRPILNSPYELPRRHRELDSAGQPTQQIIETRNYIPDFIVRVDDGHGPDDLLNLIVEIKGYRREDAKEKKSTMDNYWIPGVNQLKTYGRWAFAEFTDVYEIESDFATKVAACFDEMIEKAVRP